MSLSNDDASQPPIYVVLDGEVMLNSPPKAAWPHIMNYTSWQNFSTVEHISGPVGQEGELVWLKKVEGGAGKTPYLARTVLLEPERRVIWKIYRDVPQLGDATFGIVEFSAAPSGSGTKFRYEVFYEFAPPPGDAAQQQAFRDQCYGNMKKLLSAVMPKLQALTQ